MRKNNVRIDLDENWKLGSDSMQWILYKRMKKEDDEEILDEENKSPWAKGFHAIGFFVSLENALKAYLDARLRDSGAKSIKELYDNQQRIIQNLNEILKPSKSQSKIKEAMYINERSSYKV